MYEIVLVDEKRHELIHNKYRDILLKEVVSNNKKIQEVSYDLIIQELQEVQQYLPDDVRAEFNTKIISLIMCVGIMGFIKSHMICKEIMGCLLYTSPSPRDRG